MSGSRIPDNAHNTCSVFKGYGFNGKEKDSDGEFGNNTYDHGFRIYNPSIAKFLSVDPLTQEYPWYTPYQFARNKPIWAIDVDGLEEFIFQYTLDNGRAILLKTVDNKEIKYIAVGRGTSQRIVFDKRTGKLFNRKELGMVQYQYFSPDRERLPIGRNIKGQFVEGDNELLPLGNNNLDGSIYIGPNNPTIKINGQVVPDYRREPQDEADAGA